MATQSASEGRGTQPGAWVWYGLCGAAIGSQVMLFQLWTGPDAGRLAQFVFGLVMLMQGALFTRRAFRGGSGRAGYGASPQSFLGYENYRYLWISLATLSISIGAYALHNPAGGPSGGTWLGYTLGSVASGLMIWLMWFGVRKRRYSSRGAPLRGWLSGHVYLGLTLLLIVPIHAGFQFGGNVHTLAFALMAGVIVSGMVGLVFYTQVPTPMTRNRPGQKLDELLEEVADIDSELRIEASGLPDAYAKATILAIEETRIGGGILRQLAGSVKKDGTSEGLERMLELRQTADLDLEGRGRFQRVLELLTLKKTALGRIRRDIRFKTLLDLWLLFHVPLSFASVAAVCIHVFVVFYYR